jgi:hypothetical protein
LRLGCFVELRLVGVFRVELLQVMGRAIDERVARLGEGRQETRIRLVPRITYRPRVQNLDFRRLAADEHEFRRTGRAELLVVGDVLPKVAEVFGRERRAVRPAMSRPKREREHARLGDVHPLEEIGLQLQLLVVANEASVGVR